MTPSPLQLLIVGAIIIVLFGASRFADLGKGLGEGIKNFKKGINDDGEPPKETASKDDEKATEAKDS